MKLFSNDGPNSPAFDDDDDLRMQHRPARVHSADQPRHLCNLTAQQTAFVSVCAIASFFFITIGSIALSQASNETDNFERTRHMAVGGLELSGALLCILSAIISCVRPSSCMRNDIPEEDDNDRIEIHTESSPLLPKNGSAFGY